MTKYVAAVPLLILLPTIFGIASGTSVPRIFNLKAGEPCPAPYFMLDCNTCNCPDGKLAACTLIGCPTPNIPLYMDGMLCPAGQKFTSDCNDCNCHEDGRSATCTKKEC
ncbi:serine protease inhibitor I/II-like [Phymastichus coffea]|uniref:serine protease inhibitor I/II-like n=1 Tax=Phymastichus coffea TaxID=108790 RepID=UPI00273B7376|nr:serine protease inhibitor I/II-like [Phymastichus coffea]